MEYRTGQGNFVTWCGENQLLLNVTKEMVVSFCNKKTHLLPISIAGAAVDYEH